jgi:hypothetical protein
MARPIRPQPATLSRFVVERYSPGMTLALVRAMEPRLRLAAASITGEGHPVRYLGSILITAEETAFSVFEADGVEAVAEVNSRVGAPFDRVVPVVELREPERSALRHLARTVNTQKEKIR